MGWSLGSNDSANIFGTAVYSKTIRYRTAVILCAVFVIIGALLEGQRGMHTLSGLVEQTADSAFAAALAAALTVTIMTIFKLPVSTSQGLYSKNRTFNGRQLRRLCPGGEQCRQCNRGVY